MSDWIKETLGGGGMRDNLMNGLQTLINIYRAEGFHDVEIYHIMYGLYMESGDKKMLSLWPLYDHWLGILLDWEDEMGVGA